MTSGFYFILWIALDRTSGFHFNCGCYLIGQICDKWILIVDILIACVRSGFYFNCGCYLIGQMWQMDFNCWYFDSWCEKWILVQLLIFWYKYYHSMVELPLMYTELYDRSLIVDLFLIPASPPQLVKKRAWYVLFCAYKRSHAANWKDTPWSISSGFPLSLSDWFIIFPMPRNNCKLNVLRASLNKIFPS